MSTDRGEFVKVYEFDGRRIELDGVIDRENPDDGYDYYDLFDEDGVCLNLGEALYEIPTEDEVRQFLDLT